MRVAVVVELADEVFLLCGLFARCHHVVALQMVRELSMPPNWPTKQDNDLVALLTNETVQAGHSVLIFCCSKNQCEVVAKQMAKLVVIRERTSPKSAQPTTPGEAAGMSAREGIVAELARYQGRNADYPLKDCVSKGVAFHHAGLTADERELVERAYWSGARAEAALGTVQCMLFIWLFGVTSATGVVRSPSLIIKLCDRARVLVKCLYQSCQRPT